ncbi:MAG: Dyp-type peroxidase [Gammaproteobacteria bacterium]|jgi:putative iron-dependent peroxidase|nr:Dyp-type peroxidase [Gammaproteobacteria bacterium]MBT4077672.1 Dyp-type peroxidase [Gammaproteobacteria bacterium]MBT4195240.1 Dyp-type peroxidase [Gammaproteobacteria bacterium]MBT4451704.1 Dyp-type peroxidase [Gammaproteobacteria bacterium]MBT6701414.1 Dyp-type peroxidase [Gammaproteobacteria bacterium]
MNTTQTGILSDLPPFSRYLTFSLHSPEELKQCLNELINLVDGENLVLGLGQSLILQLGGKLDGLRQFPALTAKGIDIPSTPTALWCWIRGNDRGEIFHQSRLLELLLSPTFGLDDCIDSFTFDSNRDLSGYEDGTENPQGEDAIKTAIVQNLGNGLDGSSFVAVQKWLHDFDTFDAMSTETQDDAIGRHINDNEEFEEAPEAAHVKRSAQENFNPEAFMLRRSMPWAEGLTGGLNFVAFGQTFDAFEAVLNRMSGNEDGIPDALFKFTRPLTGSYFWCPPIKDGELDLSAIDL